MAPAETFIYRDEVAELLAAFTVGVSTSLDEKTRHAAKRALSDSIAVALGALDHPASHVARRFARQFATKDGNVLWGTTMRAHPDMAAFVNGSLLRCFDYNDFFVGERNSGHPSDITAGVISAAEWAGVSGEKLLIGLSIGYEVVAAAFDAFSTAPGGWDYTNLTAIGACCAIAHLLDLDADQTREALGMTVIPHFASDEVESSELNRRGDLTMWKRFNGSDAVRNALQACLLAQAGAEGVIRPFTGSNGFIAKLNNKHDPLPVLQQRLDKSVKLSRIADTYMKLWPVGSVAQSAIRAALEARGKIKDVSAIRQVRVFAEEGAFHHLVKIRQAPWAPISRETADHSLPYIVAAAVLDGFIRTESFDLDRVNDPARQAFLRDKVVVTPAPELGTIKDGKLKRARAGYLSRVEIETDDGAVATGDALPFPGHPDAPFSDEEIATKIEVNALAFARRERTARIIASLATIDSAPNVRDFTALLAFDREAGARSAVA